MAVSDDRSRQGSMLRTQWARADRRAAQPLYRQVEEALREQILHGGWAPGTKIPPENELCDLYGVSRITVRHALRNLVSEGLLERGQGRGTFVRDPAMVAGARGLTSFSAEVVDLGLQPGARMLGSERTPAPDLVAEALDLEPGTPVVWVRRLRTGDGRPMGVQTSWLCADIVPGLEAEDLTDRSLYALLRERYGLAPLEATETFRVRALDREHAELLDVPAGSCAFEVERITHGPQGPYEYVTSVMRGDRYLVRLALRNP